MSDLISRSELLKAMDTWDKFGYDEHNRLIKIDRTNEEYVPYVHYEDMVKCVNDMPIAYDVDNVVEELEEIKSNGRYVQGNKAGQKIGYRNAIDDFVKSIEEECGYDADINDDCYFEISRTTLLHLSEQLKAGVRNE